MITIWRWALYRSLFLSQPPEERAELQLLALDADDDPAAAAAFANRMTELFDDYCRTVRSSRQPAA